MDKVTSEIAKLTERVSKDPKSRLFVPLAEEYKKAGDIEMAIHVLSEGLRNNPDYATARYFLGRLLLDKGETAAARKELEEVVDAIPDNIPAHKKLAELFTLQGNATDALKHFRITLALNPGDKETAAKISELEASQVERNAARPNAPGEPAPSADTLAEPAATMESGGADQASASESFFMEEEVAEEVLEVEPLEVEPQSMEELFSDIDFLSQDDAGEPAFAREEQEEEETGSLAAEDGQREGHAEEAAFPAGVFEESAEEPFVEGAAALPEQEAASGQAGESSDDFTTDTLAELYIAQGFYEKAIDIYERMLADHPDSSGLREKLERVRAMAVSTEAPPAAEPAGPSQTEREEGLADFGPGPPDLGEPAVERPLYADFEPREYVPPVTGLAEAEENQSSAEEPGKAIARLEKWLANIARER